MRTHKFISRTMKILVPAVALASLSLPAVALAGTLVPPKLVHEPVVPTNTVENNRLKTTAPVLGVRTPKNSGGYTLNPVCLGNFKVYTGSVAYQYYKWRVKCPNGARAVTNGSAYTTEDKHIIQQRGSLSVATLTYRGSGDLQRVVCYGRVGGNVIPGWMDVPDPGEIPQACNVEIWGTSVPATDYGVFKYANPGSFPNGNGWWPMSNTSSTASAVPIYAHKTMTPHEGRLCRGRVGSIYYPGTMKEQSNRWKCHMRTPNGPAVTTNFQLYLNPRTPRAWMTSGNQTASTIAWNRGLNVNTGSMPIYLCRQHSTKLYGMVINTASSDKKCVVNTTYASKQPAATNVFNIMYRR